MSKVNLSETVPDNRQLDWERFLQASNKVVGVSTTPEQRQILPLDTAGPITPQALYLVEVIFRDPSA